MVLPPKVYRYFFWFPFLCEILWWIKRGRILTSKIKSSQTQNHDQHPSNFHFFFTSRIRNFKHARNCIASETMIYNLNCIQQPQFRCLNYKYFKNNMHQNFFQKSLPRAPYVDCFSFSSTSSMHRYNTNSSGFKVHTVSTAKSSWSLLLSAIIPVTRVRKGSSHSL